MSLSRFQKKLAGEKLIHLGFAGHEVRDVAVQEIGNLQRDQNPCSLLGKFVHDDAYQFGIVLPEELSGARRHCAGGIAAQRAAAARLR